jgi:hypothetical protein
VGLSTSLGHIQISTLDIARLREGTFLIEEEYVPQLEDCSLFNDKSCEEFKGVVQRILKEIRFMVNLIANEPSE